MRCGQHRSRGVAGSYCPEPAVRPRSRDSIPRVSPSPLPARSRTLTLSTSWKRRKRARWGASSTLPLRRPQEAMEQSGLQDHAGDRRPGGRLYRLRDRRFRDHRARAHQPAAGRSAQDLAVLYSRRDREHGGGADQHPLWGEGPDFGDRYGVRDLGQFHRRLGADDYARRRGCR